MLAALLLSALTAKASPLVARQAGGMGVYIQANIGGQMCLATQGGAGDGTLVNFISCNSVQTTNPMAANYALWNIMPGNQLSVQLTGTNFCLDAGLNPGSQPSAPGKVWTCYPGLEQQQFYYTGDLHIAVTGSTPCLQVEEDDGVASFVQCGSNGAGFLQDFTTAPGPVMSATTTMTMSSTSTTSAMSSTSTAPAATGMPIYWASDDNMCLTVTNGAFYDGSPVGIAPCNNTFASQMWVFGEPGVTSIQVAGQNYCIDFGTGGGSNGTPMKIWQCYPGLFQQTMYYTTDLHIAVYNGNQCLDVQAGTQNVQSWQCSGPDPNQLWQGMMQG